MSLPYFRLYPTDFEADTAHLTLIEDGAYNRLLRLCWMTPGCSLPDDEPWIMRRMRARDEAEKEAIRLVLDEFFSRRKSRVFNRRLSVEHDHSKTRHEKAVKNGAKGGRPSKQTKIEKATGSDPVKLKKANQNQNQNHSSVTSVTGAEAPIDPVKLVFDSGVALLTSSGIKQPEARRIIGRWRKTYSDQDLISAIGKAQREGAVNPVAFITGALKYASKPAAQGELSVFGPMGAEIE